MSFLDKYIPLMSSVTFYMVKIPTCVENFMITTTRVYCSANSMSCWHDIPLDGTVCGNGKICRKGKCIRSSDAPTGLSDSCPYGDKPVIIAHINTLCIDICNIKSFHHHCYDMYYSKRCCKTSAIVSLLYNTLTCEFGDSHPDCEESACERYDDYWRNHLC